MARIFEISCKSSPEKEDDFIAAVPSEENAEEDLIIEELLAEEFAIIRN